MRAGWTGAGFAGGGGGAEAASGRGSFDGDKIRAWLEENFSEPQKLAWWA